MNYSLRLVCYNYNYGLRLDLMCVCPCIVAYAEKKNQLDDTECFIGLKIGSTCFGHFYAHHQELQTICVLLLPMVCSAVRVKIYN